MVKTFGYKLANKVPPIKSIQIIHLFEELIEISEKKLKEKYFKIGIRAKLTIKGNTFSLSNTFSDTLLNQ